MEKIITTSTRIDGNTVVEFEENMKNAIEGDEKDIIVDMEQTTYICSSALRVFLKTHKELKRNGGSMLIRNVKPQILEIFEVTGFSGILSFEE